MNMTFTDTTVTTGPIALDTLPPVMAVYTPGHRWNGFIARPYIDAFSAVTTLETINAETFDGPCYEFDFDTDGSLIVTDLHYVDEPGYADEVYEPNEDGLYCLGAFGWCWTEAPTGDDTKDVAA